MVNRNPNCGCGGGNTDTIFFEIEGECDAYGQEDSCLTVSAKVLNVTCGSRTKIGETVCIHDLLGCEFDVPIDLLIGAAGWPVRTPPP